MMLNEGNITNSERTLRQIENIIKSYSSKVDPKDCTITRTSKGNWRVTDSMGKKICLISKFIMSDEIADELGFYEMPESEEE